MSDIDPISFGEPKHPAEGGESRPPISPGVTPTAFQMPSKPGGWQPPTPQELQKEIPQYKVLDLLGRGGMGAVYKGWQTSLERYVAIKILPPGLEEGGENFSLRFKNEAKTMAKLSHPGIVGVINAGQTPSGLLYFVMEFIEGTDVAQMIKAQGKLQPAHALAITAHVCDALGYAHSHGVIHRDIKPANIMLNMDGVVKVADFGLAKAVAQDSGGLTRASMAMGTPDFIAPEALVSGMVVDHRADLFAVGVMLYQMLTGKVPRGRFDAASVVVPGLDPRFDRIVDRAMKQEREQRYQNAAEIRRDLDVILTTPVAKEEPKPRQQAPVRSKPVMKGPGSLGAPASRAASLESPPRGGGRGLEAAPVGGAPRKGAGKGGSATLVVAVAALAVVGVGGFFALRKPGGQISDSAPAPAGQASGPAAATKDAPFVNTLGMKFAPVPITGGSTSGQRILFSVWETRVQDFEAFVKDSGHSWSKPADLDPGPTHAVVGVSWEDAQAFCQWLTQKERSAGKLGLWEGYRLPSDHEWSCAVGIGEQEDAAKLPNEKNQKLADVFPWGSQWPPPANSGNYWSEDLRPLLAAGKYSTLKGELPGYRDGQATVGPVGSYGANGFGLHDLGGNVWEWCEDWFDASQKDRVLRGASWGHHVRGSLLSSYRDHLAPARRGHGYSGFGCVLSAGSAR